jgi:Cytochrome b5-like Heme/Steroid binding domain
MTSLERIPPSVLRLHNKRDNAWAAFNGKVYNITPYLDFHPGGEKELMRVAGRDGTKLFCTLYATLAYSVLTATIALTHAWVNVDAIYDPSLTTTVRPRYRREYNAISIYVTKSMILDTTITCDLAHETISNTHCQPIGSAQVQLPRADTDSVNTRLIIQVCMLEKAYQIESYPVNTRPSGMYTRVQPPSTTYTFYI